MVQPIRGDMDCRNKHDLGVSDCLLELAGEKAMLVIEALNSHQATAFECDTLVKYSLTYENTLYMDSPVTTVISYPFERVSCHPNLPSNPFADLFKALWILSGSERINSLGRYGQNDLRQTDDGIILQGAYGFRVREHFSLVGEPEGYGPPIDQLKSVIALFQTDMRRRDCVIQLWDAGIDLGLDSRNLPEATQLYFTVRASGYLDLMVSYRECDVLQASSDRVAFSMIQSFIADSLGIRVGRYWQVIQTLRANKFLLEEMKYVAERRGDNFYDNDYVEPPLMDTESHSWLADLDMFIDEGQVLGMRSSFFKNVAGPMGQAWDMYSRGPGLATANLIEAQKIVTSVRAKDWRRAASLWLEARNV